MTGCSSLQDEFDGMSLTAGRTPHEREREILASAQLAVTLRTGFAKCQLLSLPSPSSALPNCTRALPFDGSHSVGMVIGVFDCRLDLLSTEMWVHLLGDVLARLASTIVSPDMKHADSMSLESRLTAETFVLDDRSWRV